MAPAANGAHFLPAEEPGSALFDCERCGNRFRALLTDGRCTTCNYRHDRTTRAGGVGAGLLELTSTPLGFSLMLIILAAIQLLLFVLAMSRA